MHRRGDPEVDIHSNSYSQPTSAPFFFFFSCLNFLFFLNFILFWTQDSGSSGGGLNDRDRASLDS